MEPTTRLEAPQCLDSFLFLGNFFEVADLSRYTGCHRWYLKAGPKHLFFQGLFGREKYIGLGPENSDGCGKTYLQRAREVTYFL